MEATRGDEVHEFSLRHGDERLLLLLLLLQQERLLPCLLV
jgi:hypothetical protein